jgi:citrate lyase beta subunit
LEDGVALNKKEEARETIARALRSLDFGKTERLARINAFGSGLEQDDLAAVLPARPDGVVIPKVQDADQVKWVSNWIAAYERSQGWQVGAIGLIAMVESARGIVNLREIASADKRVQALIFGSEDLAADMGMVRTREGREILYARSAVVTTAAAFGLQAIDIMYPDYHDSEGLRAEARRGLEMGYAGMQVIHPSQIEPVQSVYTPSDEEIAQARRVVEAYEENKRAGRGAFALDGKMVDAPIVKTAERVLARARAAGRI